jgi:hypothetical protein
MMEVFRSKKREENNSIKPTWKCKIFRQPKVPIFHHEDGKFSKEPGGLHSDFIRENVTYTEEENSVLVDLLDEKAPLKIIEAALANVDLELLREAAKSGETPFLDDEGVTDKVIDDFKIV